MVGGGGTWGYRVQEERPALIKLSEQVLQGHTNIETGDTNISKETTNIEGDTNISKETKNIWFQTDKYFVCSPHKYCFRDRIEIDEGPTNMCFQKKENISIEDNTNHVSG